MSDQKHEPINILNVPGTRVPTAVRPQEWGWSGMAGFEVVQDYPADPYETKYRVDVVGTEASYEVSAIGFVDAAEKGTRRYVIAQKDLFETKSVLVIVKEVHAEYNLCAKAYDVSITSIELSVKVEVVAVRNKAAEK